MERQVCVNRPSCKDVNLVECVSVFEYVLTLLEEFLLELVDESFERVRPKVLEVGYVEQLVLEPLLVLVLVLNKIIAELLLDIREDVQQFVEVFLADHTDRRVVLCRDCC